MPENSPVSQLTLMKLPSSTARRCAVFCEVEGRLKKHVFEVDELMTVGSIITATLAEMKKGNHPVDWISERDKCELYAARKSGKKISDLPSLEKQQKLMEIGVYSFFLCKGEEAKKKEALSAASTRSIQSLMMPSQPSKKEVTAPKSLGCFCFS